MPVWQTGIVINLGQKTNDVNALEEHTFISWSTTKTGGLEQHE